LRENCMVRKYVAHAWHEEGDGSGLCIQKGPQRFEEHVVKKLERGLGHVTDLKLLMVCIYERACLHWARESVVHSIMQAV
jgi:hypothetical protein